MECYIIERLLQYITAHQKTKKPRTKGLSGGSHCFCVRLLSCDWWSRGDLNPATKQLK